MTQITWSLKEERIQKLRVIREKRKERDMIANPEQRETSQKIPGTGKEKSTGSTLNKVLMVGVEMACNQMVLHLFIPLAQKVEPYRVDKWLFAMSTYITVASMFAPLGLDDIPGPEEATVEKIAKNSLLGIKSENGLQLCVCFASLVICRNLIPGSGKFSSDLDLWVFSLVFFMHALLLLQGVENMGEVYWSQKETSEELKRGIEVAEEVEVLKQAEATLGKFDIRRLVDSPIKTGLIFGLFILIMLMCHDLFLSMFSELTLEAIELSVIIVAIGLQGTIIYKEYVGLARKTSRRYRRRLQLRSEPRPVSGHPKSASNGRK